MVKSGLVFSRDNITLHASYKTLSIWEKHKQIKPDAPEIFGVIIGSRTDKDKEYWVDLVTTPFPKDNSSRYRFLLQDKKHQEAVDKAYSESDGTSVYLGTWHTHPEKIPTPSSIDIHDWTNCVKRNPDKQLFFLIIGIREVSAYIKTSHFKFSKLTKKASRY
ncbi:MAG: Mov34/MPN/PAD-1 family protein [Methylococcales bacterium]